MALKTVCPNCGSKFRLSDEYVGKQVVCKTCQGRFRVSDSESESTGSSDAVDRQSSDESGMQALDEDREAKTKECPYCAERVLAKAVKCRYCGEFLSTVPATSVRVVPPTGLPPKTTPTPSATAGTTLLLEATTRVLTKCISEFASGIARIAARSAVGETHAVEREDEFLSDFFAAALALESQLCADIAHVIRSHTIALDVRGTPTATLARQIRTDTCDRLDSVLADYAATVGRIGITVQSIDTLEGTVKGAVAGKILGEGVGSAIIGGAFGAAHSVGKKEELCAHARKEAFRLAGDYLQVLDRDLLKVLFDYVCAKGLGSGVNFQTQQTATAALEDAVRPHTDRVKLTVRNLLALWEAKQSWAAAKVTSASNSNVFGWMGVLFGLTGLLLVLLHPIPGAVLLALGVGGITWGIGEARRFSRGQESVSLEMARRHFDSVVSPDQGHTV